MILQALYGIRGKLTFRASKLDRANVVSRDARLKQSVTHTPHYTPHYGLTFEPSATVSAPRHYEDQNSLSGAGSILRFVRPPGRAQTLFALALRLLN